ncbi:ATP-binding protein [Ideonella sp. BN130291]|uniref:ATP-binding protein n=1 Tax=Ideonella sp. BN130291 TaxID=3112940 RepID=UPI002E2638C7|nr:ATP-binding protein [Ideonella sp. BN130291]
MTDSVHPGLPDLGVVITRLQAQYIRGVEPRQVFDGLLPELLALTGSEYGFIAEVWREPSGQPYLKVFTLTNIAWDDATRALFEAQKDSGIEFRNMNTLFGAAVLGGEPVIANEPATDPRRGGLPPGHPPMRAFLGMPLHQGGVLVGLVGLANRPGGYDQALITHLQALFATVGSIMGQVQVERERRRTEQALRDSEALYRATFDRAPLGFAQVDLEGRFLEVNQRQCQILGRPAHELRGLRFHEITHPDDLAADVQRLQALLDGEVTDYALDKRYLRPDGSTVWTRLTVALLRHADGSPHKIVSTLEDVSERRQLEHARVAAQAAERANRAKTEFLSRMSHELRTPLNAVLGFAQLLRMNPGEPLAPRQQEHVVHIERAGQHLLGMINDVLDLARIEQGALAVHMESLALAPVVDDAFALLQTAARDAGVALCCDEGDPAAQLWADGLRLRQVLVNLLSNAVKYNHRGGEAAVAWCVEGPHLRISVRDTGPGLTPAQREHLFEPFNRLGAERSRVEGSGIGLVVTRRLVDLMGGRIEVNSTPGQGSRFSVLLLREAPRG